MGRGESNRRPIACEGLWSVLDVAVEAFVLLDADGRIVAWSRTAQAMFGWGREEALGSDVAQLLAPADRAPAIRHRRRVPPSPPPSKSPLDLAHRR